VKLAKLFLENFKKYEDEATPEIIRAGEYRKAKSTRHRMHPNLAH